MSRIFEYIILASTTAFAMPETSQANEPVERFAVTELTFHSAKSYPNPYVAIDFWAVFEDETGRRLRRPGFWDGENTWKVRFSPPLAGERWSFKTYCSDESNKGLHGQEGSFAVKAYTGQNPLLRHGLLGMSPVGRNVVHEDGTPFLVVADTPWALPFRGTEETVKTYAANRSERGFNAALLMVAQPDMRAEGPRDRTQRGSFGVAFEDLSQGSLNQIDIGYFQQFDSLHQILIEHGIVPVYSPVFQGFGWKGLGALGSRANPDEYVRFVRYLLARYGASPALWLASADATGRQPVVEPTGEFLEEWDAYGQPTGIHYSPFDDRKANWSDDPVHGFHYNRVHQDKDWLDFQWAQTGHGGEHKPEKVAAMHENKPIKAAANGEPTYERIGSPDNATGWWQGHEAWQNLVSGGTMGVVYGAGGLWNWKLFADEEGWPDWANTNASWSDAIEFEGSRYVGYLSKALAGMPFTDMQKRPDLADGAHLLANPGKFYLSYLPEGGSIEIRGAPEGLPYRWFDPKKGEFAGGGDAPGGDSLRLDAPSESPWVLIVGERETK